MASKAIISNSVAVAIFSLLFCDGCDNTPRTEGVGQVEKSIGSTTDAGAQPTQLFSVAIDPIALISERCEAAEGLNDIERNAVRHILLARVPGKWDYQAAGDLAVLSVVGDEHTANHLKQLYATVPDKVVGGVDMDRTLHSVVAHIWNRFSTNAREVAEDSLVDTGERILAASRLAPAEKRELAAILLARMANQWESVAASNDANVLGEIGSADDANTLEALWVKLGSKTQMGSAVRAAIERMRKRASPLG